MPLDFTEYGWYESTMFDSANDRVREIASTQNVTFNHHRNGIEPERFLANDDLNSMFVITSVNKDLNGRPFVSSFEARDIEAYPFYAVQWHPEKNAHEYGTIPGTDKPKVASVNHSVTAVVVGEKMARVLVTEARKSMHVYAQVDKYPLIWSYIMVPGWNTDYQFVYLVPPGEEPTDNKQQARVSI